MFCVVLLDDSLDYVVQRRPNWELIYLIIYHIYTYTHYIYIYIWVIPIAIEINDLREHSPAMRSCTICFHSCTLLWQYGHTICMYLQIIDYLLGIS